MSKVLTNEYNYLNIANAIRNKQKSSTQFLPSEMAAAIDGLPTGLVVTNGVTAQYKAISTDIPEKTFVEFTPGSMAEGISYGEGSVSQLASGYTAPSGVDLTDEKSVVLYVDASAALYASVVTYNNGAAVYGTPVAITPSGAQMYTFASGKAIKKLSDTEVVICYVAKGVDAQMGNTYCAYCVVATINGTNISLGSPVMAKSDATDVYMDVTSSGYIIVVDAATSSGTAIKLSVSGTTLSVVSTVSVPTPGTLNNYGGMGVVAFGNDNIFVFIGNSSSTLYGVIGDASSSTITFGSPSSLGTGSSYGVQLWDIKLIGEDLVVYTCGFYSSDPVRPRVGAVKVSSTSVGTVYIPAATGTSDSGYSAICEIDSTHVAVVVNMTGRSYPYRVTIPLAAAISVTSYGYSTGAKNVGYIKRFSEGSALAFGNSGSSSGYLQTLPLNGPTLVRPSQTKIDGITGSTVTSATAGDIWVLNQGS